MANLYGVSNPVTYPQVLSLAGVGNVALPGGAETPIFTSNPLIALSAGFYYVFITGSLAIAAGATSPTGLNVFAKIGAGADFQNVGYTGATFPANSNVAAPFVLISPPSSVPWLGAGSTVTISVNPAVNAVTALQYGTFALVTLYRAPDQ